MKMENDYMDETWKSGYEEILKESLLMECGGEMEWNLQKWNGME